MKRLTVIWIFLLSLSCYANEMRGLWVDAFGPGFLNKKQVKQLVSDCRKYNFNAVFVQMRKRGDAFYFPKAPNEDPRNADIAPDFDALNEIIQECHTGEPRIEVHCWVVGYFIWAWEKPPPQKQHVFNVHLEWLTRDSLGQKMVGKGYYLDPGHPDANLALLNVVKDITSRYEIDGLHWDYLRYPLEDSGYNPTALKRFKEEFQVKDDPKPNDPQFSEWRRRQVTDFMRWSTAELLSIKPQLVISASVFSNYKDSRDARFQDWVEWNKEGIVDVAVPMDFSKDNRFIFKPRADFAVSNQWIRAVWIGQGGYMNPKENTLKQLQYCRQIESLGTLFYSYRNPAVGMGRRTIDENGEVPNNSNLEVIVDNVEAEFEGEWKSGKYGRMYGDDYRFYGEQTSGSAKYRPNLPSSGEYLVYEWHVAGKNRMEDVQFDIKHRNGVTKINVNQIKNDARWNLLGRFYFETNRTAEVEIFGKPHVKGQVMVADAVRFVMAGTNNSEGLNASNSDEAAEQSRRHAQEVIFSFIKEQFQPTWESAPVLMWKKRPAMGIINGTVENVAGRPIYNAKVSVLDLPQQKQRTEPHGAFAFFDVPPGEHIVAVSELNKEVRKKVIIKAGEVSNISFVAFDK